MMTPKDVQDIKRLLFWLTICMAIIALMSCTFVYALAISHALPGFGFPTITH